MTWRERRLITVLTTILLILTAAVLIVLGIRYRQSRAPQEEGTPVDPAASTAIKQVVYTNLSYKTLPCPFPEMIWATGTGTAARSSRWMTPSCKASFPS